ncbi:MAG: HAMP domain-containing histidine kinase [Sphingobacteriales bacterium]|nr:MAG: HAMP domain-containing histidine kinase [Sphingobacteriales bacterium]
MSKNSSVQELASATTWAKIKGASLRNKLAFGFITAFTLLLGISFYTIYALSAEYRKEEYYRRLRDKTITTYQLMIEVEQINHNMLRLFDRNTINSLYEEKIILFDSSFKVIYLSTDDKDISYSPNILKQLRAADQVQLSDDRFETIALKFKHDGKLYYGIAKAHDRFGKSKLEFLKWILISTFIVSTALMVLLSIYLSRLITKPVSLLTAEIEKISPGDLSKRVQISETRDEVSFMAGKFNELLDRVERAFKFQYHFVNHLSHELKTPLAIMMTNAERALTEGDAESLKTSLQFQQHALMELSHIINTMLDISMSETRVANVQTDVIRVDELLFECMDEITLLDSRVQFDFIMDESLDTSERLTISGNTRMLKMAMLNLLKNAVNYSDNKKPFIEIRSAGCDIELDFLNNGQVLPVEERERLFRHLFRGSNSNDIKGFGLGLVLVHRIVTLHSGSIIYSVLPDGQNCFEMKLPLLR